MKIYLSLFCSLLLIGCGKYGSPVAPEALAPSQVRNVVAYGHDDRVELSWDEPKTDNRGQPLEDLSHFSVLRAELNDEPYAMEVAKISSRNGSRLSWNDTSVKSSGTYQYIIVPFNSDSLQGKPFAIAIRYQGLTSSIIPTQPVGGVFGF